MGHASGMMGFPLRLLARETYERVVRQKGARHVALITGEEKIIPAGARYFLCTVESMPLDRRVEFLAVDEIQLAADPDRGHIFTSRLLHARGQSETMFLGADTVKPLLQRLVPGIEVLTRPRLSRLTYSGSKKLTRLPPRSAVVAFSAAEVYQMAEAIRRQRGGTAVVLGALSPRTRNAQVELFESGEVDYLVATDAIGMGLNLGLDHVAFAQLAKFDGYSPRRLTAQEVAQIAGRAGRHMNDGTFGTIADLGPMPQELIEAVEEHRFDNLQVLFWRNEDLDFRSPQALLRSLDAAPSTPHLVRVRTPEDQQALALLAQDRDILDLTGTSRARVRLLWDVCQVPDFRKTLTDHHARLLGQLFRHLVQNEGRLPEDWVADQIGKLDRCDGDIDVLVSRIAHVRTWTFVSHRSDWLQDPGHWRERTRGIEDRLSDSLHERLTERFLDRRAARLVRRLGSGEGLLAAVRQTGEVLVEGQPVGQLRGFRFVLDPSIGREDAKAALTATRRALAHDIPGRLDRLEQEPDEVFSLDGRGQLHWHGETVGRLVAGPDPLHPRIQPLDSDLIDGAARERIRRHLEAWLQRHLRHRLRSLFALSEADLTGGARGLAFSLVEAMGTLPRRNAASLVTALAKEDRRRLATLGVRIGAQAVYLPALLRPAIIRLRALLWAVHTGDSPDSAAVSGGPRLDVGPLTDRRSHALGYLRLVRRDAAVVLRADVVEQMARAAHGGLRDGVVVPDQAPFTATGLTEVELATVMGCLGFSKKADGESGSFERRAVGRRRRGKGQAQDRELAGANPFAALRRLRLA